jgi:lactoylglutathione lyase
MNASHIHVQVADLPGALEWLEKVWSTKPAFRFPKMAGVLFGGVTLVLDEGIADSTATIAFKSENVDEDYASVAARGAEAITPPKDYPWGVRAAYVKGPGGLTFEIEQPIATQ